MNHGNWPIILVEVVMVFGGALAFGIWQLRSVRRDRQAAAEKRAAQSQTDPTVAD